MISLDIVRSQREAILDIARQYGAHDLRVFGSVARGDADESSDLDIVARFEPPASPRHLFWWSVSGLLP